MIQWFRTNMNFATLIMFKVKVRRQFETRGAFRVCLTRWITESDKII